MRISAACALRWCAYFAPLLSLHCDDRVAMLQVTAFQGLPRGISHSHDTIHSVKPECATTRIAIHHNKFMGSTVRH
nr:MAG TPA: hypothetical protein [Bacteriophage sp.]